jgi:hypothetical protein
VIPRALLVGHAELAERVELRRQELSDALERFEISIQDPMDVRKRIATRPWTFMAAAVLIGFWLGTRKS